MSKSHQTCSCCGWSKVTSYQGLRTHQGKMGCTPKGLSIPQSVYHQYNPLSSYSSSSFYSSYSQPAVSYTPTPVKKEIYSSYCPPAVTYTPTPVKKETYASPKYDPQPNTKMGYEPRAETQEKLRTCHCGWSNFTSYQGLRIHQGKMGCTPKGLGIPENLQDLFNSSAPKIEASPTKPREKLCSVNDTTPEYNYQPFTKMRWDTELEELRTIRQNPFNSPVQKPALKLSTPDATEAHINMENKSCFKTPQKSRPSTGVDTKTRRALVFSVKEKQLQQDQIKAEFLQKIKSREQKLSEIKSCVEACEGSLEKELLEINNLFSDVIRSVKKARQRARQPLENRKDKLERDSQSIIKKIEKDIKKLEQTINEVDTAADLDANPLSKLNIKDSSTWTVDTSFSFGTLQQTVSAMMEQIQEELEKLAALELQRAPAFAVDVKLDPTTAHQWLVISKDGKEVQDGGQNQQQLPLAVGRFDMFGSLLGASEFRSGRAYWEVQVGGKTGWDLGVASAKANRKGKLTLSPDNGYWAMIHYEGENYAALAAPPVCLQLKEKPQKVGVFLDFEEGLVSFYDVTNQSHIYSFTKCSFNDTIFPYFSPHLKQNGKNSEPLVITAVQN